MTFVTRLFEGKTASLEEGPAKYRSTNEYFVLHRDESGKNCGRFGQIVKVILYIELIIIIGWLGYLSFSYHNTDRNTDCGVPAFSVGKSYVAPDEDPIPTRDKRYVVKRSVTAESVPESTTTTCWSEEEIKILKKEREERMDAFALRIMKKEEDHAYTKAYLKSIEAALNATSVSEMNSVQYPRTPHIHKYIEFLSENSSLELRKEGCEINRDLHLELFKLRNHSPDWDGYNLHHIHENITAGNFFAVNFTKEALFNDVVKFGNGFNLSYLELVNRESGDEPNKPVFGRFVYVGGQSNKGIRNLKNIFNAFVKFYFKTQDPSPICTGDTATTTSAPEPINATCWNAEADPIFLEERRERLKAYPIWIERYKAANLYTKNYLDAIGQALNATSASEIHFDDSWTRSAPLLWAIEYYATNASLEVHKEVLEIARDVYLEIEELKDQTSEWEGYNYNTLLSKLRHTIEPDDSITAITIFDDFTNFDRAFKLRYEGNVDTDKPGLGKVIYYGEEPEKLGVRHIRHILDGVVRFSFKVRHPSIALMCNSSAEGDGSTNTGQALSKRR